MPEGKYKGLDGRAVTKLARESLAKLGAELSVTVGADHLPIEHRTRIRDERTASIRAVRTESRAALAEWAEEAAREARKRLASDEVGTAAEESRRVVSEMRISRLVESARATGDVRTTARDLADRANRSYESGNLDEADVLAQASAELSDNRLAVEVQALVRYDRMAADPAKARAMRDLDDVEVVVKAFERDVNASFSGALQESARLAQSLGQNAGDVMEDMTNASVTAKMAAWSGAQEHGGEYREPDGVLPGYPLSLSRPGHVPQPEGAKLPEPLA